MTLVLVESPTKARTLSKFLGGDYKIEATMGHIRDLPKKKFGIEFSGEGKDFKVTPDYEINPDKMGRVDELKKIAEKTDKIILATDPDREGEAIAWHSAVLLNGENSKFQIPNSKFSRVVFHEITKNAILEAIKNPRELNMNLVDAQQARRILDRVVGYKLSPLLWKKVRRGLSAGRVQSVAVRLIADREKEIAAFVPVEYWEILVDVAPAKNKASVFSIKLTEIEGKKTVLSNKQEVDPVIADLEKADYKIFDIEKKEVVSRPYPPFTTSTLQQAGARIFHWSGKRTMMVAQQLYEHGFITYHRTDSFNMAREAIFEAREYIGKNFKKEFLPSAPRFYKTKSILVQEAHEAIRPTDIKQIGSLGDIEQTIDRMGKEAARLYELIWKRFMACQMADQIYDQTTILVDAKNSKNYRLQTQGEVEKFAGWRVLYANSKFKMQNAKLSEKSQIPQLPQLPQLPQVCKGEGLHLIKVNPSQNFTQPPARYTEAMLIKVLEARGIGRPSTYAPIISTIQDRGYVEKMEGRFYPTVIGTVVNDYLFKYFPEIVDYDFTKDMERDLDEIAQGNKPWENVAGLFWMPFEKKLTEVEEKSERQKIPVTVTGEKCPECKIGDQVIRTGRFGKFLSCSRFPQCKWKDRYIEKINKSCPECKTGEVIIKKTKRGKIFYGCSRYPECHWASWQRPR